ncbi:hypothetical protein WJT86_06405 [Microvirga sp. W0021]|uniref:Uncharacterized protein n=1 Tax=Hohaiivirga grylli TaxID=3133970 RepID=A0ABV0BMD0_9HYPH
MKAFLIIFGIIICIATFLFFTWFSAMGCMSTTAAPCRGNDFFREEAIYAFYIPFAIGLLITLAGIMKKR